MHQSLQLLSSSQLKCHSSSVFTSVPMSSSQSDESPQVMACWWHDERSFLYPFWVLLRSYSSLRHFYLHPYLTWGQFSPPSLSVYFRNRPFLQVWSRSLTRGHLSHLCVGAVDWSRLSSLGQRRLNTSGSCPKTICKSVASWGPSHPQRYVFPSIAARCHPFACTAPRVHLSTIGSSSACLSMLSLHHEWCLR